MKSEVLSGKAEAVSEKPKRGIMLASFMAMLATLATNGWADTHWTGPGDGVLNGDWATETNWDNGLPTSAGKAFLVDQSAAYTVSMANAANQAAAGLVITGKTATAYSTKLDITNSTLAVAGAIRVYHGEVAVRADAAVSVAGGLSIIKGGRVLMSGGSLSQTYASGRTLDISGESVGGKDAGIFVNSGTLDLYCPVNIGKYGQFSMTGGKLIFRANASNTTMLYMNSCTDGTLSKFSLSGDAEVSTPNGGNLSFGVGISEIKDNAKLTLTGKDNNGLFVQPYNSDNNKSTTLNLAGNSQVTAVGIRYVQFGPSRTAQTGTKGYLNISGGTHRFGYNNLLGANQGTYVTTITGGHTSFEGYGVRVGGPALNPSGTTQMSNGKSTINISNGVLYNKADSCMNTTPLKSMWGFVVGHGPAQSYVGHFEGAVNISGTAIVTNGVAPWVLGAGRATGRVTQTGGTVYAECAPENQDWNWDRSSLVLGLLGGEGYYTMSNGTFTSQSPVWVGGISKSKLQRSFESDPMPTDKAGRTYGRLEVAGGKFSTAKSMTVGFDGTGVVHVASSGAISVGRDLILSNSVEQAHSSQLAFTLIRDEVPSLKVGGKMIVESGSKLKVDVSGFTGEPGRYELISCTSRTGSFAADDIELVGDTQGGKIEQGHGSSPSIYYTIPKGLMLILR